jgi:hypothetical protein
MKASHTWQTRADVFAEHWDEIERMLQASPRLQGKTVMTYLIKRYPDYYPV